MKYNFESTQLDRGGLSNKWNLMYQARKDASFIPMTVADMEFETAPEIKDGLKKYIDTHILGYTGVVDSYRDTVIEWFQTQHNISFNKEHMVQTTGVVSALYALVETMTAPDDAVLILTPAYGPFLSATRAQGRKAITLPLLNKNGTYTLNLDAIEATLKTEPIKLFIFCNPHNPVGRVWNDYELKALSSLMKKYNVRVISDEIHCDLIMPSHTFLSYAHYDDEAIICTAASKTFNLATLQTSNIFIPNPELREQFNQRNINYGIHNPGALGYEATRIAYEEGKDWLQACLDVIHQNFEDLKTILKDTDIVLSPLEGTYLVWLDYRHCGIDEKQFIELLTKHNLYFSPGSSFGEDGNGFVRINIACPNAYIKTAANKLLEIINKL